MANNQNVIGKVILLEGHAYIRTPQGAMIELKVGDVVHEGDVIVTAPGGQVEIGYGQGQTYIVHEKETLTVDNSVFATDAPDAHSAALVTSGAQMGAITDAIASGNGSLDQLLDATAAGLGGGGGDGNSGHSFVELTRIAESTTPGTPPNSGEDSGTQSAQQTGATGLSGPTAQDVAVSDDVTTVHEQPVTLHLSGTDSASQIVSFTITDLPTNGTLYLADGKTPVHAGESVAASGNGADLVFVPDGGTSAATTSFHYTATDGNGAVSSAATASINIVSSPLISIDPIATVNGAEAASSALVAITGTASSVPAGDTVTLTIDGHSYTGTVQANGGYSIGVPGNVLAGAATDSVHATVSVTDPSGNVQSASADQPYNVELTAPAITITIDPIATLTQGEAASAASITITGSVSSNVPVGDTVTLTVGGDSYTATVQSNHTYSVGVPGNVLGTASVDSVHATVSATDAAGNTANAAADRPYTVETAPEALNVSIDPIAPISNAEAGSSNPVAITGTVGGSNVSIVGDSVTLTIDGHTYTGTVQSNDSYSINVPGNVLGSSTSDDVHVVVVGTGTSGASVTGSADEGYSLAPTPTPTPTPTPAPTPTPTPAPTPTPTPSESLTVGIDPIAPVASGASGSVTITGTVTGSNTSIGGDTITLTVGGQSYSGTVNPNGTYSVSVLASVLAGATVDDVHVSVTGTGATSGNPVTGSSDETYSVTSAPTPTPAPAPGPVAPSVTITSDTNHDGVLSGSEANAETVPGTASAAVSLDPTNLSNHGSATITVLDNGVPTTLSVASDGTITGAANGVSGVYSGGTVTVNFANPGDAHTASVTATQTDQSGNTSPSASANVTEHISAPAAPTVTITSDTNQDSVLSGTEVSAESTPGVAVANVALDPASLAANGSATVSVVDNGVTTTLTVASNGTITGAANGVSASYASGNVTVNFGNPGDGHSASVTASQTDQYGNASGSNSASVTEAIGGSAPVVSITSDANHDSVLSTGEVNAEATAGVALANVALDATNLANSGSATVTVVDNGATTTLSVASDGTVSGAANGVSATYNPSGNLTVSFANPGDGNTATISATQTDLHGNSFASNTASVTEHISAPPAPVVTITTDANQDGVLSGSEIAGEAAAGVATATVALNAAGLAASGSATVTVTDNGVVTTLTIASDGTVSGGANGVSGSYSNGTVTLNFNNPGDGNSVTIAATQTDQYGNTSAPANAGATEHLNPAAPVVAITTDTNHDSVLSGSEIAGEATAGIAAASVALNASSLAANGSATVTVTDNGVATTLSIASDGTVSGAANGVSATYSNGNVALSFANPGDGNTVTVSATQTDQFGNTVNGNTASATEHVSVPAPVVAITTDANQDGVLSGSDIQGEATSGVAQANVALNAADLAANGSATVTVVDHGVTTTLTVASNGTVTGAANGVSGTYSNGNVTLSFANPGDGNSVSVSATQTDQYGNSAASNTASAVQHSSAAAPVVTITSDTNHDGVLNSGEISGEASAGVANANVALNAASLAANGSATVTVNEGGVATTLTVASDGTVSGAANGVSGSYGNGNVTLSFANPGDGNSATVTATQTDQYGNTANGNTVSVTEHIGAPAAPAVVITSDANHDGVLSSSDISAEATPGVAQATVALDPASLAAHGTATVTVVDNGVPTTLTVASDGTITGGANGVSGVYSNGTVTLSFNNPGDGNTVSVSATQTDQYGNASGSNTATAVEHVNVPAPVVTITSDANHDGILSGSEVSGEATAGVAVANVALNAANLAANGSALVTVNDNGVTTTLAVAADGTVTGAANGVSGTYSNGNVTVSFNNPGDGNAATITATQTDRYGNSANSNSASVTEHDVAPATPTVTITSDVNHDGVLSSGDISAEAAPGVAQATVALDPANLAAHGSATITVVDNGVPTTLAVASDGTVTGDANGVSGVYSNGTVTLSFNNPGDDNAVSVSATQTDQYGNGSGSGTASAVEHVSVPAPVVTITSDTNQDGVLSGSEVSGEATAGVAAANVALNAANLAANGSATVTVVDHGVTTTLTVASDGSVTGAANGVSGTFSNGNVTVNFANPGDGNSATITATQTDQYGNSANSNSAGVTEHVGAPAAPTVTITSDVNHDGVLSGSDVAGETTPGVAQAAVALDPASLAAHGSATVTVVDNGLSTTLTVASDGTVSGAANGVSGTYSNGTVTLSFNNPGDGNIAAVSATQSDQYGNTSPSNTASVTEHISAPPAPAVTIASDTNQDGVLNSGELNAESTAGVAVANVSLNAASLAANGSATVTVVDDGVATTLTVAADGTVSGAANGVTGSYGSGTVTVNFANPGDGNTATVTATQTDQYGNSVAGNTAGVTEHVSAPAAPAVTITSDSNQDGVLSGSEVAAETAAGTAVATVALNAANLAANGSATVTVTDNGVTTTLNVAANGTVTGAANGVSGTYSNGTVSLSFANPGDAHTATVSATQTDQYGNNSASNSASVTEHIGAPAAPVATITSDANQDGVLNSSEANAEATAGVAVATVALNAASLAANGSATVTVVDNGVSTTLTVAANGSVTGAANGVSGTYNNGNVTVNLANPGDGNTATVTATQTDQYGNTANGNTASVTEHIGAPLAPVVTITSDANHDGVLSGSEVSSEAAAGVAVATVALNAANLAASGSATVTVVDNGVATTLTVASDGTVTGAANGVSGAYSGGTVTVNFANPGDAHSATVTATQSDQYGNTASGNTASVTEHMSAPPAPVVTITSDTNHDGVLSGSEVSAETTAGVAVATVALNAANLAASGSATVTAVDNGVSTTLNVASNGTVSGAANGVSGTYSGGTVTVNFANPGDAHTAAITATQSDQYGNTANSNTATVTEHVSAPAAPTVTITSDTNHDGVLSGSEVSAESTAGVAVATVDLNAASLAASGSATVAVVDNGVTTTLNVASNGTVTGAANGVSGTYSGGTVTVNFANPGDAHSATVSATQTDQYGNTSASNSASVTEHISAPPAPVVTITSDANQDGVLSGGEVAAEATAGVAVATVALNAANLAASGSATVTVVDNGVSTTLNVASNGTVTGAANGVSGTYSAGIVTVNFTNPGDAHTATITASQSDQYGNTANSNTATVTEHIAAPAAPTVTITSDTNHDGILSSGEVAAESTAGVAVANVAISAANLAANGTATVTVVDNGVTTTLNVASNGTVTGAANGVSGIYSGGTVTVNFANPGDAHTATVSATQSDQYGNTSASNNASVTEHLGSLAAPVVSITSDSNQDGLLNASEVASESTAGVAVSNVALNAGNLSSGGSATVTVVDNGVSTTLTVASNGTVTGAANGVSGTYSNGNVTVNFANPGDTKTATVTATETDQFGNTVAGNTASVTEHISAPPAPVVTITSDTNHDGVLSGSEVAAESTAGVAVGTVALNAANLAANGSATVTVVDNGVSTTLTVASNGTVTGAANGVSGTYSGGIVTVNFANPGDAHTATVTATQTDQYGNTTAGNTASVTEHISAPPAPVVTITSDTNHDGVLSGGEVAAESTAGVAVATVALNSASLAASGSATVTVVDNGVTTTLDVASNGTVTGAANGVSGTYSGGTVTVNFANPGDAHSATITATQSDQYGNSANSNTATVTEHISAPPAPVVTITSDTNHDGVLSGSEVAAEASAGVAVATVALNAANLAASGSATVTVVDNGVTTTLNVASNGTVTGAANGVSGTYSGGAVTVNFANPGDTHSATITATQSDQYGNTANGNTASVTEHISAPPAPVVTITSDTNHDSVLSGVEVSAETTAGVAVATVALNAANLAASGSATVTVVDNGVSTTLDVASNGTVTGAANGVSGSYSGGTVTVNFANPGDTKTATVTATQADQYGNSANGNVATVTEHVSAPPAPVVAIATDTNHDNVLNSSEIAAESTAGVAVATVALNAANLAASGSATVTVVDNGVSTTLNVASNGTVTGAANGVSGSYSGGTVTVNFANPGDTHAATVTATQSDQYGNIANGNTATVTEHLAPAAPVVAITTDTNHDSVLNSSEIAAESTAGVAVATVALNAASLAASGSATVTVVDNGVTTNLNVESNGAVTGAANGVSATYSGGTVTVNFANPGDTHTATVTATQSDQYGNTVSGNTATVNEHLAPPAPVVAITTDANHDNVLNSSEIAGESTAGVAVATVALNAASLAASGSATVTVVDNGVSTTLNVASNGTVTGAANGVSGSYSSGTVTVSFANPGDAKTATITATQSDQYGNTVNSNTATVTEHISAPPAPVVTITTDSNHDNVLNSSEIAAESTAGVAVATVALNAANLAASGSATVTVVDNGVSTTLSVASNGTVSGAANGISGSYSGGTVTVNFANPGDAHTATVTATQTDQYGNATAGNTATVTEHISAPPAPVVTITSDTNHDSVLSGSEVAAEATAGVAVATVALNAANLAASGSAKVTVVDNGVTTTLTVASNGTVTGAANGVSGTYSGGTVTVNFADPGDTHSATITATQTDQYGNSANSNTATVTEHISAPPAPVVTITSDSNHDGVLNSSEVAAESTAGVAVATVALNAANLAASGSATVTVVDNGVTTTLNVASNGTVTGAANGVSGTYSGGTVTVNFANPGDTHAATITATQSDQYGNTANSNTATVTEHLAPPAPVVTITTDSNHDGVLNSSEVAAESSAGVAVATVALNAASLAASGSATVTVVDNGVATTLTVASNGTVTGAANGVSGTYSGGTVTVNFANPGDAKTATISATQSDQYGNSVNSNTATVTEHLAPPAPVVAITTDTNHDNVLNSGEISAEATAGVAVATVALNAASLAASGNATVTVVDNGVTTTLNVASNGTITGAANGVSGTYSSGTVTVNFANPGDTHSATITATQNDQYGNSVTSNTATVTEHISAPPAPVVAITTDSNHDGVLNSSEITAESTAGVAVGTVALNAANLAASGSATVTVVDNGVSTTLTVASNGTVTGAANGVTGTYGSGTVTVDFANPGDAKTATISATQTDQYGNTANSNTATVTEHISAPPAPVVTITSDSNHDNVLSGGEVSAETAAGVAVATVALNAANLAASGSATVTVVDNGVSTTLTVASNGTVTGAANGVSGSYSGGTVTVNFANPGDTKTATVTATQTDQYGNTTNGNTATVTEHITPPPAPVVAITTDANHDNVLNNSEIGAETTAGVAVATVALNAANLAASGSAAVTVVDNGVSTTLNVASNGTVTGAANGVSGTYSGGTVTVDFANPGDTHSVTVTATQTDQYGNAASGNAATATEHITAPPAPVVAITTDANHDNVLSSGEIAAEATAGVAVATVALNAANLAASGSAKVTVIDNGVTTTLTVASNGTVTGAANGVSGTYSGGTVTVNFANPGDTHSVTVSATQTDQYGNVANSNTATATEHITAPPAPVVTITTDANHDNVLNSSEIGAETAAGVAVATVALNAANLAASGSATVTVVDNGVSTTLNVASNGTVTGAANGVSGTYSSGTVTVNFANPGDTHSVTVTATQTDQYGNVANSNTATATEHITAPPAPVVTITTDANHDSVLNSSEISAETTAGVAVATVALNAANLAASGSATVTVVDNGVSTILNVASNGTVTGAANGVSGTYSGGTVTLNFANPGDAHSVTVTATQTDQYGNLANSNTATATEHITAPPNPVVTITSDTNQDGYLNKSEVAAETTAGVAVATVALNAANLTDSGSATVTVVDNGVSTVLHVASNGTVTGAANGVSGTYSGGTVTVNFANPGDTHVATVTATQTDQYGNIANGNTASVTERITAPDAPTVAITTDSNHDGYINATELNGSSTVHATIALDATDQSAVTAGGTVQVTVLDNGTTTNLNLHMSGGNLVDGSGNTYSYSGGVVTLANLAAPGDGNSISVSSTVTDVAGNVSSSNSATAKEDITAPAAPTVAITTDADSNGYITSAELNGSSTVKASVTLNAAGQTDLANGGTVQVAVVDNGTTTNLNLHMSGGNLVDGSGNTYGYSGGVITLTNLAAPGNGNSISVTATETDLAGNVSTQGAASAIEDLNVPDAPTTAITTDANSDGYLSAAELNGGSTVTAAITLDSADQTYLANGGSVQVKVVDAGTTTNYNLHMSGGVLVDASNNPYTYSGGVITMSSLAAPGNGNSIAVSATVTDKGGNISAVSNTSTATQDVIDPPAVSIAFPGVTSSGFSVQTWVSNTTVNNALYTTAGNNGDGTNPATLINTLNSTTQTPTSTVVGTSMSNTNVVAGTASENSGLMYMQAGHTYTFSATADDSIGLTVGGKLILDTTWGISNGATVSGTFTASTTGWYTVVGYHDNQSGPGNYSVSVSDNGATAVALSSANFDIVPSVAALNAAGIYVGSEIVTTTSSSITTTSGNSSGAGTVSATIKGGYYTDEPNTTITLDSNDQSVLTAGGSVHVVGSDGTNQTLHLSGATVTDGTHTYAYSGGVFSLPLSASPSTPVVTVSATVTDTHSVSSLTTTTSEIYSGSNSLTEIVGGETFRFELGANGTAGTPSTQTISGFNSNTSSNGGDVLNLADLLQGATSSNITNYLHFTTATSAGVTTTTLHVSATGGYSSGYSASADTMQINLSAVDLVHSGGSTLTDTAIIQSLLTKGKLVE